MHVSLDGSIDEDDNIEKIIEQLEQAKVFFYDNFKESTDPLLTNYMTTEQIRESISKVFPSLPITDELIHSWLDGKYRRFNIGGANTLRIVWGISNKTW